MSHFFFGKKGEQVEISFSSPILQENLKNEIDQFFQSFVETNLSTRTKAFPCIKVHSYGMEGLCGVIFPTERIIPNGMKLAILQKSISC